MDALKWTVEITFREDEDKTRADAILSAGADALRGLGPVTAQPGRSGCPRCRRGDRRGSCPQRSRSSPARPCGPPHRVVGRTSDPPLVVGRSALVPACRPRDSASTWSDSEVAHQSLSWWSTASGSASGARAATEPASVELSAGVPHVGLARIVPVQACPTMNEPAVGDASAATWAPKSSTVAVTFSIRSPVPGSVPGLLSVRFRRWRPGRGRCGWMMRLRTVRLLRVAVDDISASTASAGVEVLVAVRARVLDGLEVRRHR